MEEFLRKTYKPKEAPWKRKVLFFISLTLVIVSGAAAYTQYYYHWTNDKVWIVIAFFSFMSLIGLFISIFGKDFWVALFLGKI
jgi:hypothetical protein